MRIGVIGLQGAVSEHIEAVKRALAGSGLRGEAIWVARPQQLEGVDGIIIPGGESTTIGKLMKITEIFDIVKRLAESGVPVLGTCAGMVVLAKRGDEQVMRTKQPLLGLMDISVVRNAFGRQRESFEADIQIRILDERPFPGVFIRAPAVKEVWGDAEVIAEFMGKIVGVKQKNIIAVAFHPELTSDTRLHEYFLRMCYE
ncbi:MAG: pyridoxal 5'-phosphate synthase glutaminase subunit PdxT [Candidatus Hadarchaeum sp.]